MFTRGVANQFVHALILVNYEVQSVGANRAYNRGKEVWKFRQALIPSPSLQEKAELFSSAFFIVHPPGSKLSQILLMQNLG